MALAVLRVQLLGTFRLDYADAPLHGVNTLRLQALLAYLILHAESPQSRQHVAFLLWPDTDESHARNNLRQFLYQLRHALPDPDRFLVADTSTVYWKRDKGQNIDIQLFEQALKESHTAEQRGDTLGMRHALERAALIYQGDLLPGCYDEWIGPERDRLLKECHTVYRQLAGLLEGQREYAAALQIAQHLLRLDPFDEGTIISLMRLYMLSGNRTGAERVYQVAVETFRRELGVAPGNALRAAYDRLQNDPQKISPPGGLPTLSSARLVGRHKDWQQLHSAWQRAANGQGHLALITGEAGIGKSRLAKELYTWAAQQGFSVAHTRSYAAEGRLSLAPIADWLRSRAVNPHLESLDPVWLTEVSRLLPELLTARTALARPEPMGEYGQRQRFFEALARAVLAAPRPMLLWIDDLQWCDSETLEWLHFLLRFDAGGSVLILGTARSGESSRDHPLAGLTRQLRSQDKLTSIELSALDAAETAKLALQIGGRELDAPTTVRLYRETEGNPLFVVETIHAWMGAGAAQDHINSISGSAGDSQSLPSRVYAVIAGRLAQLSPAARQIAELASAIGRAFTLDLLAHAANENDDHVILALDELWQRRIVREQGVGSYDFTHDKLREVTYAEISAPARRLFHRHITHALESLNKDDLDPVSAQLAAQCEQAGLFEQAIDYYKRAGGVAAAVFANDDAINLLRRGMTLLSQTRASKKRDTQELGFLLALASLYRVTQGWASSDVEHTARRAVELSRLVGNTTERVQALWLQQSVDIVAARFERVIQAHAEARYLLEEADASPVGGIRLNWAGATLHQHGRFSEASTVFEQIVASHTARSVAEFRAAHGIDYLNFAYLWNSHALWCLGFPQKAFESCQLAANVARIFPHPFSEAMTVAYFAMLQELRADADTFRAQAEEALARTRQHHVTYYHAWSGILAQFGRAWLEPGADNQARLRDSIRAFTETGARLRLPYYLSLLARVLVRAGQLDDGLAALEEAFHESRQNDEHWWDAELYRLRGELILAGGGDLTRAEAAFQQALEIAQTQQAKSLELRAAMSWARLSLSRGWTAQARELLLPLYVWFTEGFDTPDLQTAKALVAQLERG